MEHNFAQRIVASLSEDELTEIDAGWFDKLDQAAKQAYIRLHPQSKYAKYVRRNTKQAPTDIEKIAPTKEALKGMQKHLKELEYGAENERDANRRDAFKDQYNKLGLMIQRQKERIDDDYYANKEKAREEKRGAGELKRAEKKAADPRALWEKMIGRENPNADKNQAEPKAEAPKPQPKPKAQPAAKPAPAKPAEPAQEAPESTQAPQPTQPRKYTQEELQQLYKGGKMAGDYIKKMDQPQTVPVPQQPVKPSPVQQEQKAPQKPVQPSKPQVPENGPKPVSVTK